MTRTPVVTPNAWPPLAADEENGLVFLPTGNATPDYVMSGVYELEVASEMVPATVFLAPPYDPDMTRIKA